MEEDDHPRYTLLSARATCLKEVAVKLTQEQAIIVNCVYEFTFINGVCHIL